MRASMVATGFSVVTTLERTRIIAKQLVAAYGMARYCRKVRATELAVLDLENEASDAHRIITAECRRALAEDGSGAIVLGCAGGMADLTGTLSQELGVPVIDGVAVAVKFVEALIGTGLGTSKKGNLAGPIPKPYASALSYLSPR